MNYNTFTPPEILRPYVKFFYTLNSHDTENSMKTFRAVADGCPGILFQHGSNGRFYQNDSALPHTFLFGQSTKYIDLQLRGDFNAVGVYFHPHALSTIFGLNAGLLTNSCLDLDLFSEGKTFKLSDRLQHSNSALESTNLISEYLINELQVNRFNEDQAMSYAMKNLIESKGKTELRTLQHELGLSERSFERRFKQFAGISPKLFSRICCFQHSVKQLSADKFSRLSDIAYDNNYSDQSHFIRSFKEFAGLAPNQYQKQSTEIIENLSEIIL
jgi:AraC-like DNA-binding protein